MGNTVCCTDGGNDNSNNQMDYGDEGAYNKRGHQNISKKKKTIEQKRE